jgi:two-component system phosphate regulon sensor histidine kinase PhoR
MTTATFTAEDAASTMQMLLSRAEVELRTPLALIQGYIETLKTGAIKNGDSLIRCLEVMDKHSRRLMRVIDDINAVGQLESGTAPSTCDAAFLHRCLETSIERLTPLIEVSGSVIEEDIPPGCCELKGDRMVWHLVFTKLLEELLRNLPSQSRITFHATWETSGCQLEVSGNAPLITRGVPPDAHVSWGEASLGLLVVKRALELNHGTLAWTNDPQQGCRFLLSVPCADGCTSKHCR